MSTVGADRRESAVLCPESRASAAQLRVRTCAISLTVLPAAAKQHFQQHTCVSPPPTLLTVSVFSSRDLCSPPFVLQEKSLREDVEAQQPLSCSFVPTRTCQLINCASRLCAAPQLLCLSTRGCCCCIGCKFQKGGSTMTSSRRAT